MRYALMAGGKRFRPCLTLAPPKRSPAPAGIDAATPARSPCRRPAPIEMIHSYSLVHDDLPAMDNDTLRRGRPTSHVVYGEAWRFWRAMGC